MTGRKAAVVVPVYQPGAGFGRVIAAIAREAPAELVVVDDGSTHGVNPLLHDVNINVVTHRSNRGRAAARNTGWRRTTAPIVAFLDADIAVEPGYLDALIAPFADPQCVAVVGALAVSGSEDPYPRYLRERPAPPVGEAAPWRHFLTGLCAVRRSALEAVGGFREDVRYGEDLTLACALSRLYPRGLVHAPSAVGHMLEVDSLESVLDKMRDFGRNLRTIESHCPDVWALSGLGRLASDRVADRALLWMARRRTPASLAHAVARHGPRRWTPPAVRYLLGHALATAFHDSTGASANP